ncbi:MAG: Rne/Rng family ribonuclease [Alphaproteobacteria bacterium]
MSKKMLIDATHSEETRVAVVDNGRLDEFDYESAFRKPLKGNIYLAKVTRVEPSLQAAFVNFGGNRHGFLPFSEIHPDYFRIPVADQQALLAEQEEALRAHDEEEEMLEDEGGDDESHDDADLDAPVEDEVEELGGDLAVDSDEEDEKPEQKRRSSKKTRSEDEGKADNSEPDEDSEDSIGNRIDDSAEDDEPNGNVLEDDDEDANGNSRGYQRGGRGRGRGGRGGGRGRGGRGQNGGRHAAHRTKRVETFGGEEMDEAQRFRFNLRRKYKIQEVIKRGQIMLVQVSKEERGNKGAAVGSYLSLPGRYCVLMPNSPRGGGVSRKISNYKDRAKMRDMMKNLEVPKGMSVILRTAGVTRTKTEVKRDLDYLLRLWNNIVELTKESYAPALVYEEADLIKRAVRDHYTRDVEEIHVSGAEGYKSAKNFMKMMIPSHVKKVIEYKDEGVPLFNKFKVEGQIAEIGETSVTLKSGGYLVINPTEALVSIDVNSGKATKERHIEETALKTNLEAAEEVARQLRLRDLGGLVVIDFIDMEDRRNNSKVERKMRDALSGDRARIQMGRISSFGLMELSRQRMSASLTESQFESCPSCQGSGRIRTADAASIMVLRAIEAEGIKGRASQVIVHVSNAVALYILNHKRAVLAEIESRYGFAVLIRVDDSVGASGFRVEVAKPSDKSDGDGNEDGEAEASESGDDDNSDDNRRGGRRRGRRGGRGRGRGRDNDQPQDNGSKPDEEAGGKQDDAEEAGGKKSAAKKEAAKKPAKKSEAQPDAKSDADSAPSDVKSEEKPEEKKPAAKKPAAAKKSKASNDDGQPKPLKKKEAAKKDETPKDYETVNEAPKVKKKGWWSK